MRRVLITGIGLVTPLGDRETTWRRLLRGDRAVRRLAPHEVVPECGAGSAERGISGPPDDQINRSPHRDAIGAPVADVAGRGDADVDPVLRFALAAAEDAWADAGLAEAGVDPLRLGCAVGTSKGAVHALRRLLAERRETGRVPAALPWDRTWPNTAATAVAERFAAQGAVTAPVLACATGLAAVLGGADLVRDGRCDVVLAGSGDASLLDHVLGSFGRLGVLARADGDPAAACRPFDRTRCGFVPGEGAAILVLEDADHARSRNATPYAAVLGGTLLNDASGPAAVDDSGVALARAVADALALAGRLPADVDHLQLHGTATRRNDRCESRGLQLAFGDRVRRIPASGAKGALGHLLGAAGSVETALAALSLRDGLIPPTANHRHRDPELVLDVDGREPRRARVDHVLKTSLGFGGHVGAILLGRAQ